MPTGFEDWFVSPGTQSSNLSDVHIWIARVRASSPLFSRVLFVLEIEGPIDPQQHTPPRAHNYKPRRSVGPLSALLLFFSRNYFTRWKSKIALPLDIKWTLKFSIVSVRDGSSSPGDRISSAPSFAFSETGDRAVAATRMN